MLASPSETVSGKLIFANRIREISLVKILLPRTLFSLFFGINAEKPVITPPKCFPGPQRTRARVHFGDKSS